MSKGEWPAQGSQTELQRAVDQVRNLAPADAGQGMLQTQILAFCAEHPDALYRTCLEGHLTASAAIVDPGRAACLVLHHVKLDRWLQPGGHADGQGDLAAVALREAEEETGITGLEVLAPAIDLDIHRIPERPREPEHLHLDVRFLVICPDGAEPVGNHESHALAWWDLKRRTPQIDASTSRLLESALSLAL